MRFDTPVYFQTYEDAYNALTGDYSEEKVSEVEVYASVTQTGTETLKLVYGDIRQNSLTVRLQNHYRDAFERIRVGDKTYRVDVSRKLPTKQTFIVSEAQ